MRIRERTAGVPLLVMDLSDSNNSINGRLLGIQGIYHNFRTYFTSADRDQWEGLHLHQQVDRDLNEINAEPRFPNSVLWTDKTCFTRGDYFNTHNSHIWSEENSHVHKLYHQWKLSVNIWAGIM